jgi:hypothetical protein
MGLCGLLLLAVVAAEPASPSRNVSLSMDRLAERIAQAIKGEKQDAIAIRTFIDRSTVPSNAGPGLVQLLRESLQKQGLQVKDDARLEVGGEYFTQVDDEVDRQAVYVRAIVRNEKKREVFRFGQKVHGARAIASLLALTVDDLPPDEDDQDAKIRLAIAKPHDHIQGSRSAAGPDSPYAVEIVVKEGNRYVRRPLESRDGRAFVSLRKDEIYAVRLINNSSHDAAVTLSIDGLSLFAFNEEKDTYSHVLIPAKKAGLVKGWYRTRSQADAFTITGYADSAAARSLKDESAVGAITATFAIAWKESEPAPEGENSRSADIGTGRGPNVPAAFQIEPRHYGRTRASISIRYAR